MSQPHVLSINITELKHAVSVLRALNHKLRQSMLHLLDEHNRLTVTEIFIKLRMEQSVVSQHLGMLRRAGLVHADRDGKFIYYSLNKERLDEVAELVSKLGVIPEPVSR